MEDAYVEVDGGDGDDGDGDADDAAPTDDESVSASARTAPTELASCASGFFEDAEPPASAKEDHTTSEPPSTNDPLIEGLRQADSALPECSGAKHLHIKIRRRLLLECKRREAVPSAIRAAVRAGAVSRGEEVHAKRTAAEAEDATAKRRKAEFDLDQLKVKRALIEDRTAHRRLLLRQCTERSAKALAAEAQAAERAWAKKVRCEFAAWLHTHLLDRMPKVHMPSLETGGGQSEGGQECS